MNKIHFENIDSTNAHLKKHYENYDNQTFVSADYQSDGRGRNTRNWKSEKAKNLLFSLLLKNNLVHYQALSIITAYTIIKVLEKYNLKDLMIKWPNDVYVKDFKICGILLEGVSIDKLICLIIGVGLNVNQIEFDEQYLIKPTSMKLQLDKEIDIEQLKEGIYSSLLENINKLNNGYSFYEEIKKYDYLIDKEVYVVINNKKEKVKVIGINEDYSLRIILNDTELDINSGEISFHI